MVFLSEVAASWYVKVQLLPSLLASFQSKSSYLTACGAARAAHDAQVGPQRAARLRRGRYQVRRLVLVQRVEAGVGEDVARAARRRCVESSALNWLPSMRARSLGAAVGGRAVWSATAQTCSTALWGKSSLWPWVSMRKIASAQEQPFRDATAFHESFRGAGRALSLRPATSRQGLRRAAGGLCLACVVIEKLGNRALAASSPGGAGRSRARARLAGLALAGHRRRPPRHGGNPRALPAGPRGLRRRADGRRSLEALPDGEGVAGRIRPDGTGGTYTGA